MESFEIQQVRTEPFAASQDADLRFDIYQASFQKVSGAPIEDSVETSEIVFDYSVYQNSKSSPLSNSQPSESGAGMLQLVGTLEDASNLEGIPWPVIAQDLAMRSNMFTAAFYVAWSREVLPRLMTASSDKVQNYTNQR